MSAIAYYLRSSILKKQLMGITGLLLCGFLLTHFLGNTLLFVGSDAFNIYAHTLTSNKLIYLAEAVLGAIFLTHVGMAMKLVLENKAARGDQQYFIKTKTGRGSTFASSTMPYTGVLLFIFIVKHLLDFKFGPVYWTTVNGTEMRDIYRTVVEFFASPVNVILYIVMMFSAGVHVSHGFWSAFQSIGFNHKKYNCVLKMAAKGFAALVALGYSSFAIFCFLKGGM
ncbi:MAG: succinate dehydrogenase cytochrome b subunit [Bdellovibrionota bacterium]|nr:succinate dehydrogenase cytochrome b subunit [Bdellovibrionota bacterium]